MKKLKPITCLLQFLLISISVFSQNYVPPLRIPPSLSANFGELRDNHFHSGLDYRTQKTINKPVFAVSDGYISRINISPVGYGLALYITHPDGFTTVYGHLNSFSKKIAAYAKRKQYEKESFSIDISLKPSEIPIKKGEQIALSGNSGGSGGPHLHFEIRNTKTEEPIDPFVFLRNNFTDTQKPEIQSIAFYPLEGKGTINGSANPVYLDIEKSKSGNYSGLEKVINAWGTIGVGVRTIDRMNGETHFFGVKSIRLFADNVQIFGSKIDRFPFDRSRMVNSFVDFEMWRNNKSFYAKSFIEQGNTLPFYNTNVGDGLINISSERIYNLRYELEDHFGNILFYAFTINGKKQSIPQKIACKNRMYWDKVNLYLDDDFDMNVPVGSFYSDFCYKHTKIPTAKYYSDIHQINDKPVPMYKSGLIWIKLKKSLPNDTTKYGIIEIDKAGKEKWIGGKYKRSGIEVGVNELGKRYAVTIDTVKPILTTTDSSIWLSQKKIVINLKDDKSGVAIWRGEIDGKFAVFSHDMKSNQYIYDFDDERLIKGRTHKLVFTAIDGVGNRTKFQREFEY